MAVSNKPPKRPKGSYTHRIYSGGRVTIPADIRKYFGFKPGKRIKFVVRGNTVYLKKV